MDRSTAIKLFFYVRSQLKLNNLKNAEKAVLNYWSVEEREKNSISSIILVATYANLIITQGKLEESIILLTESFSRLKLSEEDQKDISFWEGFLSLQLGIAYLYNTQFSLSINSLNKAISCYETLDLEEELPNVYYYLSIAYFDSLETTFSVHIQYFEKTLALYKKYNNQLGVGRTLYNIAHSYLQIGDLEMCKEYLDNSRVIITELDSPTDIGWLNLIELYYYFQHGEIKNAKDLALKNIPIYNPVDFPIEAIEYLYALILIFIHEREILQAHIYLDKLKEFNKSYSNKRVELYIKFATAFIMANENNLQDKSQAQTLFESLLEEKDKLKIRGWNFRSFTSSVMLTLLDLYIEEHALFNNHDKLDQALNLINSFLDSEQYFEPEHFELAIKKSKILILKGENPSALRLLQEIKIQLSEKDMKRLEQIVVLEIDKIEKNEKIKKPELMKSTKEKRLVSKLIVHRGIILKTDF